MYNFYYYFNLYYSIRGKSNCIEIKHIIFHYEKLLITSNLLLIYMDVYILLLEFLLLPNYHRLYLYFFKMDYPKL